MRLQQTFIMEENESKPERKQVEMSIWFIILLVVVIVFMCIFMSMNKKLGDANTQIEALSSQVNSYETRNRNLNDGVKALLEQYNDLTPNQLKARLETLLGTEVEIVTPQEPVVTSGEVISGEVVVE